LHLVLLVVVAVVVVSLVLHIGAVVVVHLLVRMLVVTLWILLHIHHSVELLVHGILFINLKVVVLLILVHLQGSSLHQVGVKHHYLWIHIIKILWILVLILVLHIGHVMLLIHGSNRVELLLVHLVHVASTAHEVIVVLH
jgi:hypothetical protein